MDFLVTLFPLSKETKSSLLLAQHSTGHLLAGLLAGGGVHVEILEEHLGSAGGRSAVLGVVLGLDVDGRGNRRVRIVEGSCLAVGAGDTVALGPGCLDDQLQVGHIRRDGGKLEGHRLAIQIENGIGRRLNTGEGGNGGHDLAAAVDHPVVQPHEEVAAGDLALGAQHRATARERL